jgi:hypothetical protein
MNKCAATLVSLLASGTLREEPCPHDAAPGERFCNFWHTNRQLPKKRRSA